MTTESSDQNLNDDDLKVTCPQCQLKVSASVLVCPNDGTLLLNDRTIGASLTSKYQFIEEIGSGGMGIVFKAKQTLLNRLVAIKTIHLERLSSERILRFQREAEAASRLSHPNLVSVFDFGLTERGQPYMVMDYLEGMLLSDLLRQKGSLGLAEAAPILDQICAGLGCAHNLGVIHRDLKPSNVMVLNVNSGTPSVKIFDFGIAKILGDNNSTLTQSGDVMGSPNYMSPEQILGRTMDHRSDIYSFGCLIFELLTGIPPFSGRTSMEAALKQVHDTPPTLREGSLGKLFPQAFESIVSKALRKDPDDRYQSVIDLQTDLNAAAQGNNPPSLMSPEISLSAKEKVGSVANWKRILPLVAMLLMGAISAAAFISSTNRTAKAPKAASDEASNSVPIHQLPGSPSTKVQPDDTSVKEEPESAFGKDEVVHEKRGNAADDPSEGLVAAAAEDSTYHDQYTKKPNYDAALFFGQTISLSAFRERALVPTYITQLRCSFNDMNDEYLKMVKDKPFRVLSLRYTHVTSRGLACLHMPTLTVVKLEGQNVTDDGISNLSKLTNLTQLSLFNNPVTDDGIKRLRVFKKLQYLKLGKNYQITDHGLTYLKDLPISHLWLEFDPITDKGLQELAEVKTLRDLRIPRTHITNAGMKVLAQMPLFALDIDGTMITDAGLMQLTASKTLRQIRIKDTLVTADGTRKFLAAQSRCKIVENHDSDYLY